MHCCSTVRLNVANRLSCRRLLSLSSHARCQVSPDADISLTKLIRKDRHASSKDGLMLKNAKPYLEETLERISQAKRSVVVRNTMNSKRMVENWCSKFGQIQYMEICPKLSQDKKHHHPILVEFADQRSADDLIASCEPKDDLYVFNSTYSRIITFLPPKSTAKTMTPINSDIAPRPSVNASLKGHATLGGCVRAVKETIELPEIQVRRNYMQCQLVNDLTQYHMPNSMTIPHGSVLSGLSTIDSDLDMVLHPLGLVKYGLPLVKTTKPQGKCEASFSPIVNPADATRFEEDMINFIGFIIRNFSRHSCSKTIPLPNAKTPIIRYESYISGGRCDLLVSLHRVNEGVMSSCILRRINDHLPIFRHLSHCLRFWAKRWRLTNPQPGKYLINFTLTHLLIFYLQQSKILPSIRSLLATDPGTSVSRADKKLSETDLSLLGELYRDFFSFCYSFDYTQVIDINTATALPISQYEHLDDFTKAPMRVVNTQDLNKNIAFRMDDTYHDMFVRYCRDTHNTLSNSKNVSASFLTAHRL